MATAGQQVPALDGVAAVDEATDVLNVPMRVIWSGESVTLLDAPPATWAGRGPQS